MDALWDLCTLVNDDYMPYEWWISYPSTDPTGRCIGDFHISSQRGSDKSSSVSFVTGINTKEMKYAKSSRDTYQRCQIIGSGEGKGQDDCSSFWQDDSDAMDETQGFIEDIVTQKQVSGGRIANRYAKVQLKLDASPKRKNAIDCYVGKDTYPTGTWDCGDMVVFNDFLSNINGAFRIWNTKVTVEDQGEITELTAQAPDLDIGNVWKDVYQQLKTMGVVGVIATDWAGDGTAANKVAAEKLADLFSVSAKNETTDASQGSTDPKWYKITDAGQSVNHSAGWKGDSGNLSIWGGDSGGLGSYWAEARYNTQYDANGVKLPSDVVDIPMVEEPKFTTTFKVWEGKDTNGNQTIWNTGDYVDFGMFNIDTKIGFLFRVVCVGAQIFTVYGIFYSLINEYNMPLGWDGKTDINGHNMINTGIAKVITSVNPMIKYKAIIEVEYNGNQYGNALPEVLLSITNEEVDGPIPSYIVFTKFNSPAMIGSNTGSKAVFDSISVRPIFVLASGDGSITPNTRCVMYFYEIKCQRDVVVESSV